MDLLQGPDGLLSFLYHEDEPKSAKTQFRNAVQVPLRAASDPGQLAAGRSQRRWNARSIKEGSKSTVKSVFGEQKGRSIPLAC